jgi:hypothetical protein
MKTFFPRVSLTLLVSVISMTSFVYAQSTSTTSVTSESDKPHRNSVAPLPSSLSPAERMAWREIQERIDRMSHGEEAKDLNAAMHFMAEDYTLYTLPDKESPKGKVINRQQIAVYKRQNLDSLYSTSPETHTVVEDLSLKGNLAKVVTYQKYVRVIRGGDGSPHEARTSVRHREMWIYTDRGWLQKTVQELERGPIFLDGQPFNP